jgi:hypothetical protein
MCGIHVHVYKTHIHVSEDYVKVVNISSHMCGIHVHVYEPTHMSRNYVRVVSVSSLRPLSLVNISWASRHFF